MSDNHKRFRAVRNALNKLYPKHPQGNLARQLNTLAAIISGIVGGKTTNLPKIASKVPDGKKVESRVKKFSRWVKNKRIKTEIYFLPFAEILIAKLCVQQTLVLAIDGSVIGRGCIVLMVSVIYKTRALPICWIVVRGKKGHLPEKTHVNLVKKVQDIIPKESKVVFLGDGEFDGIELQKAIKDAGWKYVCRTGRNIKFFWNGHDYACGELSDHIKPGEVVEFKGAFFTNDQYGPVNVICWWRKACKEPIYLVTNVESITEVCDFYSKRFRIETFFSDQKSRGFNLHKSHISDPKRLSRMLIASCLAYIWIVYLGTLCIKNGWNKIIHRNDRCDLSLFQLGLRLLEHFVNEGLKIPVAFHVPVRI